MFPAKKYTIIFLLPFLCLISCLKPLPPQSEFVLGTICTVNLYDAGTPKRYGEIFARIREVDRKMSVNQGVSEVIQINQNAGTGQPVKVSVEALDVLEQAAYYAALSGGAFDPTVGPLVTLWGIGTEKSRVPSDDEIAAALALIDFRDLVIDRENGTAYLRRPGQALDLGAIAKGFAADEAAAVVRSEGLRGALIDLGGNIFVLGARSDVAPKPILNFHKSEKSPQEEKPWRVGVQDPLQSRGAYIGVLEIYNKSVVTSGVYERYFESGGKKYHHILSTKDGYPVENGLLSVTIISESSTAADGLSTSVFALGYEKGRALIDTLENTEAIFVFADRSIRMTDGAQEIFTLTNNEYRLD